MNLTTLKRMFFNPVLNQVYNDTDTVAKESTFLYTVMMSSQLVASVQSAVHHSSVSYNCCPPFTAASKIHPSLILLSECSHVRKQPRRVRTLKGVV